MKNSILFVPLAFILGGLVGYWSPCKDLRTLEERHLAQMKAAPASNTTGFNVLSTLVKVPSETTPPPAPKPPAEPAVETTQPELTEAVVETLPPETLEDEAVATEIHTLAEDSAQDDFAENLEQAADLWRSRSAIAKATIVNNLGLNDAQTAQLNRTLDHMNARLKESFEVMAENMKGKEKMDMELGVRMLGDVSATLAETYDEIGVIADPAQREAISDINLIDFIDPSVAKPLESVAGKL